MAPLLAARGYRVLVPYLRGFGLGYDVTMVRDATADYSDGVMHAALDVNIPNDASAVVTTVLGWEITLSSCNARERRACDAAIRS